MLDSFTIDASIANRDRCQSDVVDSSRASHKGGIDCFKACGSRKFTSIQARSDSKRSQFPLACGACWHFHRCRWPYRMRRQAEQAFAAATKLGKGSRAEPTADL